MAMISWGKPKIEVCKLGADGKMPASPSWTALPTPVADSTQLTAVKGDKMEARIEGGEFDDIRYKKSTYSLVLNLRKIKGQAAPIANIDGYVDDHYAVRLTPEDASIEGFVMNRCAVSVEDSWTAADGSISVYTFESLTPESGKQIEWKVITA